MKNPPQQNPQSKAILSIGGQAVCTVMCEQDPKQKDRFVARRWISYSGDPKDVVVYIGGKELKAELHLESDVTTTGNDFLTAVKDEGILYYWANLTPGKYKGTHGFTAGYLDHTDQKQEPIQEALPFRWKREST